VDGDSGQGTRRDAVIVSRATLCLVHRQLSTVNHPDN
jgi:hypothetical protein